MVWGTCSGGWAGGGGEVVVVVGGGVDKIKKITWKVCHYSSLTTSPPPPPPNTHTPSRMDSYLCRSVYTNLYLVWMHSNVFCGFCGREALCLLTYLSTQAALLGLVSNLCRSEYINLYLVWMPLNQHSFTWPGQLFVSLSIHKPVFSLNALKSTQLYLAWSVICVAQYT